MNIRKELTGSDLCSFSYHIPHSCYSNVFRGKARQEKTGMFGKLTRIVSIQDRNELKGSIVMY